MEAAVADGQSDGQAVVAGAAGVDVLGHFEADWWFVSGGGVRGERLEHLLSEPSIFW